MKKVKFDVEGVTCGGCVKKIQNFFSQNSSVKDVNVSIEAKTVELTVEDSLSNMTLRNEIQNLGYAVKGMKQV